MLGLISDCSVDCWSDYRDYRLHRDIIQNKGVRDRTVISSGTAETGQFKTSYSTAQLSGPQTQTIHSTGREVYFSHLNKSTDLAIIKHLSAHFSTDGISLRKTDFFQTTNRLQRERMRER